jgi:uncharacterized protein (DUF305 family)
MTNRFVLPGFALAAALTLTACSASDPATPPDASPAPASSPADAGQSGAFADADVTFARAMIPHHEQALTMADALLAKDGTDPRVVELAEQISAAQAPEIAQLTEWLGEWGADIDAQDGDGGHGDHSGMAGMMSEADLAELDDAEGEDAGRLFLTQMIEHHEGAVAMARTELEQGEHAGAREMARAIVDSQSAEIAHMRDLLGDG